MEIGTRNKATHTHDQNEGCKIEIHSTLYTMHWRCDNRMGKRNDDDVRMCNVQIGKLFFHFAEYSTVCVCVCLFVGLSAIQFFVEIPSVDFRVN